jgi:pyruvate dehydrogenase E2 component (dihydrolipoamide acetyltransferase)
MPQLVMPKMGDAMEEGTIVRWLKSEGDPVAEEEIIAEIATEKANIEIPSSEAGPLTRILVKEGETVPIGTPIAVIGADSPATAVAETAPAAATPVETPTAAAHGNGHAAAPAAVDAGPLRAKASPLARKVAAEHGLDLRALIGSGPGGRIVEADVAEALRRTPAPLGLPAAPSLPVAGPAPVVPAVVPIAVLPGSERPLSPIRRTIAKRLTESKQTIPHFYLTLDVDMRAAVRLRAEYNASVDESRKISFNDLVARACVIALQKHRALTSRIEGDVIKTPSGINLGVAVSLEEGLIVPVVKDAQNKSLTALGQEVRELAGRARRGQLKPEEYSGGSFTISNLGMYEITQFQAIINPPEVAILAVGAIRDTPIVEGEAVVPGKQMHLTISVDHRVVDGSVAAEFMAEVKSLLQKPLSLFS